MKQYTFKTNINCSGCVARVAPYLDRRDDITEWKVETAVPEKKLTVTTEGMTEKEVELLIGQAGFKAEPIK